MVRFTFRVVLILFIAIIVIGSLPSSSSAMMRVILNEHFDRDPEQIQWPWATTPPDSGWGWYHNVRRWPRPYLLRNSDCGWGWQDYIYSSHILQEEDFPGSIWCAYRTSEGENAP
ncbi:hypothetical protein HQ587_04945, partial [bacterium]|nr:hypothetical protein [bacterium]